MQNKDIFVDGTSVYLNHSGFEMVKIGQNVTSIMENA
jgi:hypothetical protein